MLFGIWEEGQPDLVFGTPNSRILIDQSDNADPASDALPTL